MLVRILGVGSFDQRKGLALFVEPVREPLQEEEPQDVVLVVGAIDAAPEDVRRRPQVAFEFVAGELVPEIELDLLGAVVESQGPAQLLGHLGRHGLNQVIPLPAVGNGNGNLVSDDDGKQLVAGEVDEHVALRGHWWRTLHAAVKQIKAAPKNATRPSEG